MTEWHSRAPVRFCDLGGWTDTRIVRSGSVLNFAARMYTYVALRIHEGDGQVTLESLDTDERSTFRSIRQMEYDGVLDLLKAALIRATMESPNRDLLTSRCNVTVLIRSDAPPASGLGSSAALGVAAIACLAAYHRQFRLPHELARQAHLLEVEDLKLECGVQDQFAAAYGGVNFMEVEYPNVRVFPISLSHAARCELEDRFVLVYTGKSRFSSTIHQKVMSESGKDQSAFDELAQAAILGKESLLRHDLDAFATAMNRNWEAQKSLHPEITTAEFEELQREVFKAGAAGFKVNGAGGGGTATILAKQNHSARIRRVIEELGMVSLPALIDTVGLQTWTVEA